MQKETQGIFWVLYWNLIAFAGKLEGKDPMLRVSISKRFLCYIYLFGL